VSSAPAEDVPCLEKPDEQQDDEDEDENASADIHDPWEPPNEWSED
jgi:hypothetical protein